MKKGLDVAVSDMACAETLTRPQAAGVASHDPAAPQFKHGGARPGAGRPRKAIPDRIQSRPLGPRWYVVQTAAQRESVVVRELVEGETRPGYTPRPAYEAELPIITVERIVQGQRAPRTEPMMRGYVFVKFDRHEDDWRPISTVPDVIRLFTTRSLVPIPVPVGYVEMLIADAPNRLKLPSARMRPFEPGDAVAVLSGPLAGHSAVCVECDGLTTLVRVRLFGEGREVRMARDALRGA